MEILYIVIDGNLILDLLKNQTIVRKNVKKSLTFTIQGIFMYALGKPAFEFNLIHATNNGFLQSYWYRQNIIKLSLLSIDIYF